MSARSRSGHRSALKPVLVVFGGIALFAYGTVALLSQDARWFLNTVELPAAERIVIRVDGVETVLTPSAADYGAVLAIMREELSNFKTWAPGTMGLSESTLTEYESHGTIVELYFDEGVDFHLPFPDGSPTALLLPIAGRHGGEGYVFRGKNGKWWAGQLTLADPQPLYDGLAALGYFEP